MEKGLNTIIKEQFGLDKTVDVRTVSPLTLAYIGDGIYELVIRTVMVAKTNTKAGLLHRQTSQLVKAQAQSQMMDILMDHLTPEEESVFRRGRNAKSPTMAKNATVGDYRRATGFEALMGYLYLTDQMNRLLELVQLAVDTYQPDEGKYMEAHNRHGRESDKSRGNED
ncbi:MAG: ribonuclease III domain-containing protein [bacterium]|nr:ribonuclease III domain-containing protein [bacterium]